jgi:hypothetical protein
MLHFIDAFIYMNKGEGSSLGTTQEIGRKGI